MTPAEARALKRLERAVAALVEQSERNAEETARLVDGLAGRFGVRLGDGPARTAAAQGSISLTP
jgi:hypothetical protein